jgi:hypothetical protein
MHLQPRRNRTRLPRRMAQASDDDANMAESGMDHVDELEIKKGQDLDEEFSSSNGEERPSVATTPIRRQSINANMALLIYELYVLLIYFSIINIDGTINIRLNRGPITTTAHEAGRKPKIES